MRYRDECMPLVSSVDTIYYLPYDLRVAQLNNKTNISPCFFMSKSYYLFFGTPSPCYKSDKKRVCNRAHQCVCSYSYLYYLHEYKLRRCARTCIIPPSRLDTQPLVMLLCGFFWRSNRGHYLLVLVMRALTTSIYQRAYVPTEIQ